ncbi:MAG: translation initiation factor [Anaerolineae bacterium]
MPMERDRLVYSTDGGKAPKPSPPKGPAASKPAVQQTAAIRREKKGRGGKTVTVVYDLVLKPDDLKALGKRLKTVCGTGGTVKDGTIEIQGDHRDAIAAELQRIGYRTKFTGG